MTNYQAIIIILKLEQKISSNIGKVIKDCLDEQDNDDTSLTPYDGNGGWTYVSKYDG